MPLNKVVYAILAGVALSAFPLNSVRSDSSGSERNALLDLDFRKLTCEEPIPENIFRECDDFETMVTRCRGDLIEYVVKYEINGKVFGIAVGPEYGKLTSIIIDRNGYGKFSEPISLLPLTRGEVRSPYYYDSPCLNQ